MPYWLIAASTPLLLLTAPPVPVESDPAPKSAATEIIDGRANAVLRMTVPVTIGDAGPFDFLVDTGAQATVVSHRLADRLVKADRSTARLVAMASERQVDTIRLNDLRLGSRTFDNLLVPLLDDAHIGADGILGLDSLQGQSVLINFRDNTMAVRDAEDFTPRKGYEIVVRAKRKLGQLIITSAKIDGISTTVLIDTGSAVSVGNIALLKKLRRRNTGSLTMTDVNGVGATVPIGVADSFHIGSAEMRNMTIAFIDGPPFRRLGLDKKPALILGMRDMRLFDRVAIDFHNRRVLFDLPRDVRHTGA